MLEPQNIQAAALKVINYNTWHGLGSGLLKREELEPEGRKEKRFQEQIKALKQAKPDILFLQEVNPVPKRTKQIAQALGMSSVFQVTNCGISVMGLGLPSNLNMGISILVRPPLEIKKLEGLKLSGLLGACNPLLTFQLVEFRYALFASAYHPKYGPFLLVNTHFHHGVEWSSLVREQIDTWEKTEVITRSQRAELEGEIEKSNLRRKQELDNLFTRLNEIRKKHKNPPFILAGDFNSTISSPIYKEIIEIYKLKDSAGNYSPEPYTWNPLENEKNHEYTGKFSIDVVPTFDKKELEDFFKKYDRRRRRIDYVFVSPNIQVLSHSSFANQQNPEGLIPSDHFGALVLINTYEPLRK